MAPVIRTSRLACSPIRAMLPAMGDLATTKLPLVEASLRRWRAIYLWITIGGVVLTALLGLYLHGGGQLEGPAIAFSLFAPGVLVIGLVLLIPRLSIQRSPVVRALAEEPHRVRRIGLKRTESTVAGARAAAYSWVVIELEHRANMELLVRSADVRAVVEEIRRVAPAARFDPRWSVERLDLRIR